MHAAWIINALTFRLDAEAFIVHKVLLLCYLPAMILTYCSDEEGISTLITA